MSKNSDPLAVRRVAYGLVAWVLLGLAWWQVVARDPRSWVSVLAVPVVSVVVVTVLTLAWVRHNRGIYQRKGPRRGVPAADAPWTADSLGRRLELAPGVAEAAAVRLDLEGDVKRYVVAP